MLPDSTAIVVEFLADRMDVPVSSLVPRGRNSLESPARLITVTRTGGPALNRAVDKPMLLLHAWGTSSVDASHLAQEARLVLLYTISRYLPLWRKVEEVVVHYTSPAPVHAQDLSRCIL